MTKKILSGKKLKKLFFVEDSFKVSLASNMNPNEAEKDSTHIFIRWRSNEVYDEAAFSDIANFGYFA